MFTLFIQKENGLMVHVPKLWAFDKTLRFANKARKMKGVKLCGIIDNFGEVIEVIKNS
jgi:hypothetical protein